MWFLLHLVLLYVQRSDQLRMHNKVLQPGDKNNYVQNLTFFAGDTDNDRLQESIIDQLGVTNDLAAIKHWFTLDKSDTES